MGLFLVTLYAAAEHYSDEGVGRLMLGYVIGYFVVPEQLDLRALQRR